MSSLLWPFGGQFRRFLSSPLAISVLVAFIVTPLAVAGTVLWSNWNPPARAPHMAAALVNEDQPAQVGTKTVSAGDNLSKALLASGSLDWQRVDRQTAESGLESGAYYIALYIPSDYSESVSSINSGEPRSASLSLQTNDAVSVLTPAVAAQAIASVDSQAEQQVQKGYIDGIYDALGLGDAASKQNSAAAADLVKAVNAAKAADTKAATAAKAAADQVTGVASSTNSTAEKASTTSSAAQTAQTSASSLPGESDAITAGATQVNASLKNLQQQLTSAGQLDFAAQVGTIITQLQNGVTTPAGALAQTSDQVTSQTQQTSRNADDAAQTAAQTNTAANTASSAVQTAIDAGAEATKATAAAVDSANNVNDALKQFADSVPPALKAKKDAVLATLASPVNTGIVRNNQVAAIGDGITSEFVPAALMLGTLLVLLFVPALYPRLRLAGASGIRQVIASSTFLLVLAAAQLVVMVVVLVVMGLHVAAWLPFAGMLVLTALCAVALMQFLRAWLGNLGLFLGGLLILLQLSASAGALPRQALSGIYSTLSPFMPMTYAADGVRRSIAGGPLASHLLIDAGILIIVTVVAWALTVVIAQRRRGVVRADLNPGLQPVAS